jgi:hypothetical protein
MTNLDDDITADDRAASDVIGPQFEGVAKNLA